MADGSTILLSSNQSGDQIKIDLRVLEIILGIAANQIDGVSAMRGGLRSNWNDFLGRNDHGRGVFLHEKDGHLTADVYASFDYGVKVPDVAVALQKKLRAQLTQMTGLNLDQINIHVGSLVFEKSESSAPKKELFEEDNQGEEND